MPFSGFGREFYLLESDGTDTWVWYTPDFSAAVPTWTQSATISGVYTVIRPTSTPGQVYIYSSGEDAAEWCEEFDFTIDQQGWTFTASGFGTYNAGVGFVGQAYGTGGGVSRLNLLFANAMLTSITVTHTASGYTAGQKMLRLQTDADPPQDHQLSGALNGTNISSTYNQANFAPFECDNITLFWDGADSFNMTITHIQICGEGFNPFGATGNAVSRYSTDYGATFAAAKVIGDPLNTFGGMDTVKVGSVALAGSDGVVKKATSGGAWADYGAAMPTGGQPGAIWIPKKAFGSTVTDNSGTTPDYLVASGTLSAGGHSMWKVINGTMNAITPQIAAVKGLAVSPNCLAMPWWSGNRISAILNFGGTRRLVVSTDAGSSWTATAQPLSNNATYIRYRKGDKQMRQLFIADTVPVYSPDHGGTLYPKTHPSPSGSLTDALLFCDPYG